MNIMKWFLVLVSVLFINNVQAATTFESQQIQKAQEEIQKLVEFVGKKKNCTSEDAVTMVLNTVQQAAFDDEDIEIKNDKMKIVWITLGTASVIFAAIFGLYKSYQWYTAENSSRTGLAQARQSASAAAAVRIATAVRAVLDLNGADLADLYVGLQSLRSLQPQIAECRTVGDVVHCIRTNLDQFPANVQQANSNQAFMGLRLMGSLIRERLLAMSLEELVEHVPVVQQFQGMGNFEQFAHRQGMNVEEFAHLFD